MARRKPRIDREQLETLIATLAPDGGGGEHTIERASDELRAVFETFSKLEPMVSVFGSARTKSSSPDYQLARRAQRMLGDAGFGTITGGGPGIMEAANRGASEAGATSVGLNIKLPREQKPNDYQTLPLHFHYFFTRKIGYIEGACGYVVYPGGLGTMDELFEFLTLTKTMKIPRWPVVLAAPDDYWKSLISWMRRNLLQRRNMIDQEELDQLVLARTPREVRDAIIAGFEQIQPTSDSEQAA